MTPVQARCQEILPFIQAGAEGKQLQIFDHATNDWVDFNRPRSAVKYRVKPKPSHRPYTPQEAIYILGEWLRGDDNVVYDVRAIEADGVRLTNGELITYQRLLSNFKRHGHYPCGVLVLE